jgi:exonuclease SbcC
MRASKPCCPPIARPQPPAKASQADAAAKAALQAKQNEQARVAAQQQAGVAWLQQHKHWKALALQWERWDVLFVQAGQAAATAERLASGLSRVQRNAQMHRDEEADASAKLAAAVAALQRWTRSASRPRRRWPRIRSRSCRRRAAARAAPRPAGRRGKIWLELASHQARHGQIETQSAQLRQAMTAPRRSGGGAAGRHRHHGGLLASRARWLAEAACAASVESLRQSLEDDTPCPVCGALDHPYRHHDDSLQTCCANSRPT